MIRRGLTLLAGAALVLAAVVLVRAGRFVSRQAAPPSPAPLAIDSAGAIERLAQAIRIPTVSEDDPGRQNAGRLLALRTLLDSAFPRVHAGLRREVINGSLLYTWVGSDAKLAPLLLAAHMDVVPAEVA